MLGYFWSTLQLGAVILCTLSYGYQAIDINNRSSIHYRQKRTVECKAKYEEITSEHSACLSPTWRLKSSGVNSDNKRIILDMHNKVRREVDPTATDMMLMSWDDEIATTAQRWMETCPSGHDKAYKRYAFGRFTVGQNLATGQSNWKEVVNSWASENSDYSYTTNNKGKKNEHYTQMVWASSAKIGCGYAECGSTRYFACNYGPAGNTAWDPPYTSGTTCRNCPDRCNNGLCDCDGRVCLNGGDMNLKKCTCKCTDGLKFYLGPTCGLNCSFIKEPWQCESEYKHDECDKQSHLPLECPDMCGWCPTAAFDDSSRVTSAASCAIAVFAVCVRLLIR